MINHIEGFDRSRKRRGVAEVALKPFDAFQRLGKRAVPAKRPHAMSIVGQPPAQIGADEAAAAKNDTRGFFLNHAGQ